MSVNRGWDREAAPSTAPAMAPTGRGRIQGFLPLRPSLALCIPHGAGGSLTAALPSRFQHPIHFPLPSIPRPPSPRPGSTAVATGATRHCPLPTWFDPSIPQSPPQLTNTRCNKRCSKRCKSIAAPAHPQHQVPVGSRLLVKVLVTHTSQTTRGLASQAAWGEGGSRGGSKRGSKGGSKGGLIEGSKGGSTGDSSTTQLYSHLHRRSLAQALGAGQARVRWPTRQSHGASREEGALKAAGDTTGTKRAWRELGEGG